MTTDQREVLDLLVKEWRIRLVRQQWLLKESGMISSYTPVPGGASTILALRQLGYIDAQNTITHLGRAAAWSIAT